MPRLHHFLLIGFIFLGGAVLSQTARTVLSNGNVSMNGVEISKPLLDTLETYSLQKAQPMKFYTWKDSMVDTTDYSHLDSFYTGIVFSDLASDSAYYLFNQYSESVKEEGNFLFLNNLDFRNGTVIYDVVILKAESAYDVINIVGTQAPNYGIGTNDIIERLKLWDNQVHFNFTVIDYDRVEAYMEQLPPDLKKFTKEIYEFCPDVIDQGYGSMKDMIKNYKEDKYFWMWWD